MIRGRSTISLFSGAALLALLALALAACGSSSKSSSATPATTAAPPTTTAPQATLSAATTGLGSVLVDAQGRTVYMFSSDTPTTSACTGACASAWPPVDVTGTPAAGSGAKASLLGTLERADGSTQVTYNGHPLYTFVKDTKAGDTNGQGVKAFGGSWSVVNPAGNKVVSATPPTSAKPQSGTVNVAMTGLGNVLVNAQGRTVYMFSPDTATTSACTGACAGAWPPVTVTGAPTAGAGANASMVGTLKRADGSTQVTYNGHPLYTFVMDQKAGDTNGQGISAFGGNWSVISPAGAQIG